VNGETAWEAGSLGPKGGAKRLLFGQMYEDVEIEREAFAGRGRVFSIASAGCTALRLAGEHEVVACDINPVQLEYAKQRADGGAMRAGDAEQGMEFVRRLGPLAGWRRSVVEEFLTLSEPAKQMTFWRRNLDTRRFRVGFDILLSRLALGRAYSQAFLAFLPARFGSVMQRRWERGFGLHANASNPYARALLLGELVEEPRRERQAIEFVLNDAASYLETCAPGSFDGFTLSNILDGATPGYKTRLERAVRRAAAPGAVVVRRSFAKPSRGYVGNHARRDRSLLWGLVEIRDAASL
jgi:S-adenosylmethionine:diacylglycerol 3-amino-3-carboxypropyl transferase